VLAKDGHFEFISTLFPTLANSSKLAKGMRFSTCGEEVHTEAAAEAGTAASASTSAAPAGTPPAAAAASILAHPAVRSH
jgi:hypothetical protein